MTSHRIRLGYLAMALFILALCLSPIAMNAQTYTDGSIAGTVFDSTGAVVPGASVSIINNGTNAQTTLKSDTSGYYKAPILQPGTYTVTVTSAGFETFKEVNVQVVVNETTEVSPHMVTGSATTNVEVTGEAPILNFESPEISSTLTTHDIEDLPLNGGRWSDMALLTPGAVGDANGFGLISFRGITPTLNNVEVDGADDNQAYYSEERGRTREGYSTSKYAIDEFTVNTGVYSTEYGRAAGGVINAVTKSGSNTLHGIAYFSDRDNDWGTVNPFTTNTVNSGTLSAPNFVTSPYKPKDWRKEWGFDAGGTLKKDKLFWFYGFNQYDRNFPGTAKPSTPGTFFTLPDSAAPSGAVCNVTGTTTNGYMSGLSSSSATYSVDEQACALAARLDANGINVASVGVPTTYAQGAEAYVSMMNNVLGDLGPVPRQGHEELNTPKLDWQVNQKNHVSVLYHRLRWDSPGGVQTQATNDYSIDSFGMDFVKVDYGLAKLDSQISTNISNEVRYQFGRELDDESNQPLSSFSKNYLEGFNGATAAGGGFSPNVTSVALDSPGTVGFYMGSEYYDYRKALPDEHKWQVGDTAAWIHGNHDFKFGIDLIHNYDVMNNTYEGNGVYTYSYIGNYFADIYNEANAKATGLGICNSVSTATSPGNSGTPINYTGSAPCGTYVQGFGPPVFTINTTDYGVFGEDHWKLSPRLTVDVGLRWDYESLPPIYSSLVTPSGAFAPLLGTSSGNEGLCENTNGNNVVYTYTGPGTCPSMAANANFTNDPSDKLNFGPRLGMAYDPFGTGKTTVRIGYGMYFGRIQNGTLLNVLDDTGSPSGQYTTSSFKPNTAGAPLFPNLVTTGAFSGPSAYFFSKGFRNPQIHEFDASVQQEVGRGTIFQLSYMGALSRELPNALNVNLNPNPCSNCGVGATASPNGVNTSEIYVNDQTNAGPLPNGTIYFVPTYNNLIDSNYGAVNELFSNANATYNAMVAEIENRTSKLIQFDVNYTWSHATDWNQGEYTTTISNGWMDPYNIDGYYKGGNYGSSIFNVGNRLVAYALINSPVVNTSNQFLKLVSNDWSFNPVFQGQNGLPYSATIASGFPSTSAYSGTWNGASGSNYWVPFIGRNTYDQPRTLELDMRLEKQIPFNLGDKPMHLQLMGEVFNAANHPNVTGVNSGAYTESSNSGVTKGCSVAGTTVTFGAVAGQGQIECSTMTFTPRGNTGNAFNYQTGFGAATNADSNFAYSPRQVMLTMRIEW